MNKEEENRFLDFVEKYMKQHHQYWMGVLGTCLVSDVHDIEESILAKRKTVTVEELKEMFPDKPTEEEK